MLAAEIMNRFFVAVRPTDSVQDVVQVMTYEHVGIVCVCDDAGCPLGVLTDRDIIIRVCSRKISLEQTVVLSVMTPDALVCRLDSDMSDVEILMQKRSVGRLFVVDDQRRVVGVITLAEIWHFESPHMAGALSRRIFEREFRVAPTGGHFDCGRPSPHEASSSAPKSLPKETSTIRTIDL